MPFKYNPLTRKQDYYENGGPMGPAGPAGANGHDGVNGRDGAAGSPGAGVPVGGAANQVLVKVSGTDYDTAWIDAPASGGGSISILTATGAIDDSNTSFSFTSSPTLVVVNGIAYRDGHGCTISGLNVTLDNPVGINGDIYGIGSTVSVLTAAGAVDDSNLSFTFTIAPTLVIVNGAIYREGKGFTRSGLGITLDYPVGTGGDIYGI